METCPSRRCKLSPDPGRSYLTYLLLQPQRASPRWGGQPAFLGSGRASHSHDAMDW